MGIETAHDSGERFRRSHQAAQMQDLLGLGDESRMNRPGKAEGNWRWRMLPDALTLELATRMRELTRMSGRLPGRTQGDS